MNSQQLLAMLGQLLQAMTQELDSISGYHLDQLEQIEEGANREREALNAELINVLADVVYDFDSVFTQQTRALTAAFQTAARTVGGGNRTANNTPKGMGGDAATFFLAGAVKQLTLVVGPLVAFSTVLNQTTSGLQLFLSALNILGMTIAPLILPGMVVLAAGVLMVSDEVWQRLLPSLKDFSATVLGQGIASIQTFSEFLIAAARGTDEFAEQMGKAAAGLLERPGKMQAIKDAMPDKKQLEDWNKAHGNKFNLADPDQRVQARFAQLRDALKGNEPRDDAWRKAIVGAKTKEEAKRIQEMGPEKWQAEQLAGKGKKPKTGMEKAMDAVDMVLRQLEFTAQPKASLTGIAQASRSAQLAAVSASPMEQKQLQILQDTLRAIRQGFAELRKDQKRQVIMV